MADQKSPGHGHVRPRPDGVKARCGGPGLCAKCRAEAAALAASPAVSGHTAGQAEENRRALLTRVFEIVGNPSLSFETIGERVQTLLLDTIEGASPRHAERLRSRKDAAAPAVDELASAERWAREWARPQGSNWLPHLVPIRAEYDRRGAEIERLSITCNDLGCSYEMGRLEHERDDLAARVAELEAIEQRAEECSTWCGDLDGMHRAVHYIRTGEA